MTKFIVTVEEVIARTYTNTYEVHAHTEEEAIHNFRIGTLTASLMTDYRSTAELMEMAPIGSSGARKNNH